MKRLVILLCLLGASCEPPTNGQIIGKRLRIKEGIVTDTTVYYIKIQDETGNTNEIQVSKEVWEKASNKMVWPFEVK